MGEVLISVVVPNYNNVAYLTDCINSIQKQTHQNLEIIILDDKSTDSSRDLINELADADSRIKKIFNTNNIGISRNRNNGIMIASGVYITTLDADDYLIDERKIELERDILESHQDENIIAFSNYLLVNGHGKVLKEQPTNQVMEGDLFSCVFSRTCMIPRDYMFTKKQYVDSGGLNPELRMYEDWDLKIRMSKNNKFIYTCVDGIGYRRHGEGLSSVNRAGHYKWLNRVFSINRKRFDDELDKDVVNKFNEFIKANFTFKHKFFSLFHR